MKSALPCILTINGGSSSIRFAVYEAGELPAGGSPERLTASVRVERI